MNSSGDFSPTFLVGQFCMTYDHCHDCSPANQPLELGNTTFKKSTFEETINRKQYYYNIIIILLLYIIIYDYLATIGYKYLIIQRE